MLSSYVPYDNTTDPSGSAVKLIVYETANDWSCKFNPRNACFKASDFDVAFLYLHKELGCGSNSGVWISLPDRTVIFYCNFWQSATFGVIPLDKDTISIDNIIEGNYYLGKPDLNEIGSHVFEVVEDVS